jgi:hypothetical protein
MDDIERQDIKHLKINHMLDDSAACKIFAALQSIYPILRCKSFMGASQAEPRNGCNVCGRMFHTVEDLVAHNQEAHLGGRTETQA